jgi:hypothetical protein
MMDIDFLITLYRSPSMDPTSLVPPLLIICRFNFSLLKTEAKGAWYFLPFPRASAFSNR